MVQKPVCCLPVLLPSAPSSTIPATRACTHAHTCAQRQSTTYHGDGVCGRNNGANHKALGPREEGCNQRAKRTRRQRRGNDHAEYSERLSERERERQRQRQRQSTKKVCSGHSISVCGTWKQQVHVQLHTTHPCSAEPHAQTSICGRRRLKMCHFIEKALSKMSSGRKICWVEQGLQAAALICHFSKKQRGNGG